MTKNFFLKPIFVILFLISYSVILGSFFSGCIRLTGGAGVWKQNADDEVPISHEVGFDTAELVPQSNQAKVTT